MAGEIPDGLAIEHVWVVDAIYGPDAAERRSTIRAEHLARMAELREAGTIIEVGGYADMSGSLILVRLPSEEAVSALVKADVYFRTGVWTGFRIRALGLLVRLGELSTA